MNSTIKFTTPVSKDEHDLYRRYFRSLDRERCKIVTAEVVKPFMEQSGLSGIILAKIWSIVDIHSNGFLNFKEFCAMIRILSNVVNYGYTSSENMSKIDSGLYDIIPNPIFEFTIAERKKIRSLNLPLLTSNDLERYSRLFDRTTSSGSVLPGEKAREIFMKAKLPNEILGDIWVLVDREQKGSLNKIEFSVAMHLIGLALAQNELMNPVPRRISKKLWQSAGLKINSHNSNTSLSSYSSSSSSSSSRSSSTTSLSGRLSRNSNRSSNHSSRRSTRILSADLQITPTYQTGSPVITRTLSGSSLSPDLKKNGETKFESLDDTTSPWVITLDATRQYYKIFQDLDKEKRKELGPHIVVPFFLKSGLTRDMLASIWDLSDINKSGFLNVSEFIIATFLINNVKSMRGTLPQRVYPELLDSLERNLNEIVKNNNNSDMSISPEADSSKIGLGLQIPSIGEATSPLKVNESLKSDELNTTTTEIDEDMVRQIAEAKETVNTLNAQITESQQRRQEQNTKINETQLELDKLEVKKKECENELIECKQLEDSLFDRLTQISNSTQENNNKIEKLELQILESKKMTVQLNQKMSIAEGNYHASQARLHSLESQLEEVIVSNRELENEINNINFMTGSVETKLLNKSHELEIYQDKVNNNKKVVESKKLNMEDLQEKLDIMEDQLNHYLED